MKTISPVELQRLIAIQPDLSLLDVRTPVEYAEVHVAQARNVPLAELNPGSLADSGAAGRDRPVYLLCRGGQRAARAAEKLAKEGFAQPVIVEGGTLGWIGENLPVIRGTAKVISLERQVRIAAGAIVFTGVLLAQFVHPAFIWLSGFAGAGLVFAGVTDFCGMGLLLARLPWNKRPAN